MQKKHSNNLITNKPDRYRVNFLAIFIIASFSLFFIYPLILAIKNGFIYQGSFSFHWIISIFSNRILVQQILNSFFLACAVIFVVTIISVPLAMLSSQCKFKGKGIFNILVLMPMILPPFVGALSVRRFLGQFGILNIILERIGIIDLSSSMPPDWMASGFIVVTILQSLYLFPIMYLNLTSSLSNIDPSHIQAAKIFQASGLKVFRYIILPLLRPGIFAGGSIVFIWSFTDIGTPLIIGYEELAPVTVFKELSRADNSGRTFGLVFVLLLFSALFYLLGKVIFGKTIKSESAKATLSSEPKRLGYLGNILAWLFFGCIIFLAVLPHIGVVITAFSDVWIGTILPESYTLRHLRFVITQSETRTAIFNSVRYAGFSTLLDIIVGSTAAWLMVRKRPFGTKAMDVLLMMPLAVPGIILASGFIAMTAQGTFFEKIGPFGNPFWILVIAYAVRRIPFIVRGVSAGLQQIPETLEHAACNLGASPVKAVFLITLPLIAANIIASSVLTFAFAMLEVSDSLMLAQVRQHYPITKEIYTQAISANTDAVNIASALGVIGMFLLGSALTIAVLLLGKKLGAIFRA